MLGHISGEYGQLSFSDVLQTPIVLNLLFVLPIDSLTHPPPHPPTHSLTDRDSGVAFRQARGQCAG